MIKVSIVVPAYNVEKYIDKCLDSLVNQTLSDIEVIVVNDGSTDNTSNIIQKYEKKYQKIIKVINQKNQGIGTARNNGIKIAKGEYLGFVDSDDYVDYKMYEEYYNYAKENKLDIVNGYYYKNYFEGTPKLFKSPYFEIGNVKANPDILNKIEYGPCNKMFRMDLIKAHKIEFIENRVKYEDVPFIAKALLNAKRIGHINEAYYYYLIHGKSETTTMDDRVYDIFKIFDIINNYYKDKGYFTEELELLNINKITTYMLQQKHQKDKAKANKFIEAGYEFLDNNFPNWKKNKLYNQTNYLKRVIKNNPFLVRLYCNIKRKK